MNVTTVLVAVLIVALGVVTAVLRVAAPDSKWLRKYRPMQERWGRTPGTVIHVIAYTVLPITFGLLLLRAGLAGGSLTDFLTSN